MKKLAVALLLCSMPAMAATVVTPEGAPEAPKGITPKANECVLVGVINGVALWAGDCVIAIEALGGERASGREDVTTVLSGGRER